MIVIFDGCDNTGKTTIAQALARRLMWTYFKYTFVDKSLLANDICSIVNENLERYSLQMLEALGGSYGRGVNIIIDRHYPSDYVYGRMFRNRTLESLRKIEEHLIQLRHLIVICTKDEIEVKDDAFVDKTQQKTANNMFRDFKNFSNANVLLLDTTDENLEKQLDTIIKRIC